MERRKNRATYLERTEERFVHVHHGTCVVKLAAIVGRREDRHELTIREELIAILDDLLQCRRKAKLDSTKKSAMRVPQGNHDETRGCGDVSHVSGFFFFFSLLVRCGTPRRGGDTNLMSPTYQIQIVLLQKSRYDVWAKRERYAAIVGQPPSDGFIRIRPEEVTKDAFADRRREKKRK